MRGISISLLAHLGIIHIKSGELWVSIEVCVCVCVCVCVFERERNSEKESDRDIF